MRDTLVIIPTYNEIENIEPLTRAVLEASENVDILIVDDNSPDGTGDKADQIQATEPRLHVLRTLKDGLGRAYVAGFQWALEHDYEYITEMVRLFTQSTRDS